MGFWWENLGDRDHGSIWEDTIKWTFRLIQIIHMTPGQQSGKN
jgi:hypothetical protein